LFVSAACLLDWIVWGGLSAGRLGRTEEEEEKGLYIRLGERSAWVNVSNNQLGDYLSILVLVLPKVCRSATEGKALLYHVVSPFSFSSRRCRVGWFIDRRSAVG